MENAFMKTVIAQFQYYKMLGDKTLGQVSDEQLFVSPNAESNSIAMIVKHLWGNMRSRWIDFRTTDGEKTWRNRETEFADDVRSREEVMRMWEEGWNCLFQALESVNEEELMAIIYIRNQGHTLQDAILRQLAHYPYHVGQMVYLGKMFCGERWQSLSIPRGGSEQYNQAKFDKPAEVVHFTKEFLKKNN